MSTQAINKHFNEFRAVKDILQSIDYERIILDDRPDVIVEMKDGRIIGIEVMNCVVSRIRSNNNKNRVRVTQNIREAEEKYKQKLIQRGENHISIHLTFTDKILDAPQEDFTKKFIEEIERHRKNDKFENEFYVRITDKDFCEEYKRIEKDGGFKYDYIKSIECFEHSSIETNVYHLCCFLFSGNIEENDVEFCIKKKEPKIEEYRKLEKNSGISEYWLAIWVPSDEHMNFDNYEQQTEIESEYQRIYISYPFNACKRLK
jgi:hypothetical protein